jgi:hypothetical protein
MPKNPDAFEFLVREWVVRATALPDGKVIFDRQNAVRPPKPYATVRRITEPRIGRELVTTTDEVLGSGVKECVESKRRSSFSINFYGAGSFTYAEKLELSKSEPAVLDWLWTNRLTLERPLTGIRDLTAVLDTEWEERANQDWSITYVRTREHETQIIETVTVTDNIT